MISNNHGLSCDVHAYEINVPAPEYRPPENVAPL